MAGSIIIDDKTGVAFNSQGFEIVSEHIRGALKTIAPDLIIPIYESKDVGYMSFISIEALKRADVRRFYAAANEAFLEWKQYNSEIFPEWVELLEKLEADARLE